MANDKTQAELFKAELETLMQKYPTIRLTVNHQISIDEIVTPPVPGPNPVMQVGEQKAPEEGTTVAD